MRKITISDEESLEDRYAVLTVNNHHKLYLIDCRELQFIYYQAIALKKITQALKEAS